MVTYYSRVSNCDHETVCSPALHSVTLNRLNFYSSIFQCSVANIYSTNRNSAIRHMVVAIASLLVFNEQKNVGRKSRAYGGEPYRSCMEVCPFVANHIHQGPTAMQEPKKNCGSRWPVRWREYSTTDDCFHKWKSLREKFVMELRKLRDNGPVTTSPPKCLPGNYTRS